jgi:hypothetical protein
MVEEEEDALITIASEGSFGMREEGRLYFGLPLEESDVTEGES